MSSRPALPVARVLRSQVVKVLAALLPATLLSIGLSTAPASAEVTYVRQVTASFQLTDTWKTYVSPCKGTIRVAQTSTNYIHVIGTVTCPSYQLIGVKACQGGLSDNCAGNFPTNYRKSVKVAKSYKAGKPGKYCGSVYGVHNPGIASGSRYLCLNT